MSNRRRGTHIDKNITNNVFKVVTKNTQVNERLIKVLNQ